jgi:Ca-activated chloride channel homolog
MRWVWPQLFHLLWAVPALALLVLAAERARRRVERRLGDPAALRRMTADVGPLGRTLLAAVPLVALAAGVLALARPQAGFRLVTTTSQGADVVIALDLSLSMSARDVRPDRLGAARREILALLRELEGSRVGLVAFAGTAKVVSPLSTDLEGVSSLVETAGVGDLAVAGSDIGAGLRLAGQLLRRPGEGARAVLVLSDGENLSGDPNAGLEAVRGAGARLFAIGVGDPAGASIPIVDSSGVVREVKRDSEGKVVISRLDEPALRALARGGGGAYERGDGTGRAARRLLDSIRSTGAYEARGRSIRAYDERYPWLAAAAGLLLVTGTLIPSRRRR